ncbi:MAG: preprotein translocase subunit YajC [Saprospiraceae bacterium]|nr:preprotein translocase subunit YajC [Saprospiraceae bacterium]HMW39775.1 preprotein translocase subunit YajC [Saprospiraceae bacterium]HMX87784.1 preprotein translocase subunit YajC [Saprospiraceae bacterium]HMZ39360.1 preprotein translocase subunit YajC [Saprospiraceae bacterium]HNA64294.1 preprotein translocase subunit YajC [Saprospiraceae bacterium]
MASLTGLLPILLVFVIMYFFFLRPQIKKQKEQNDFVLQIKKGDQVATGSGIIGRVSKVEQDIIELQVDGKTFLKVLKSAVSKEATESLKNNNYLD